MHTIGKIEAEWRRMS